MQYLDFESPIAELEGKIVELRTLADKDPTIRIGEDVTRLQNRADQLLKDTYAKLTPWQRVQVARHPARPHFVDYVSLFDDFTPLAGDRLYGEDAAMITGLAKFRGQSVAVVGQEKGSDTETRLKHKFGMASPEGYRKVQRIFAMAERFSIPVISLVDTAGAYAGVAAEERGQAEAIARTTQACLNLKVPLISVIIGEGGSGGAIAIATANRVYMLENSMYSVISPEGCASILWRKPEKNKDAASALKITAKDLLGFGIIDGIIPEPVGGAHRAPEAAIANVGATIATSLDELSALPPEEICAQRRNRFLAIGRDLVK